VKGRIVHRPTGVHSCDVTERGLLLDENHQHIQALPGTVWKCDCGRTFVAMPRRPGEMFPRWRREGRIARWRRERPERKEQGRLRRRDEQAERTGGCYIVDDVIPPAIDIAPEDILPPSAAIERPRSAE
jgi:hypothetical protein